MTLALAIATRPTSDAISARSGSGAVRARSSSRGSTSTSMRHAETLNFREVDKLPMGAVMNKALVIRTGQQHGQRYIPRLIEHIVRGEIDPTDLATHRLPIEEALRGYDLFASRKDGCLRVVFSP
ncbi:Threonine dehydrogenase [Minicystis rosea]|nr:Threonine dehydrogenase [Minicystis rosea]